MDTEKILDAAFKRLSVPDQVEFKDVWITKRREALKVEPMEYKGGQYMAIHIDLPVYLGKRDGKGVDRTWAGYSKGYIERSLKAMRLLEEGYRQTDRKVRLLDPVKVNGKLKYPGRLLVEMRKGKESEKVMEVTKGYFLATNYDRLLEDAKSEGYTRIKIIDNRNASVLATVEVK